MAHVRFTNFHYPPVWHEVFSSWESTASWPHTVELGGPETMKGQGLGNSQGICSGEIYATNSYNRNLGEETRPSLQQGLGTVKST